MKIIKLTDRVFNDLANIESYSKKTWGNKVAGKYLDDIEAGLNRLQENADLLQDIEGFSGRLKFYRIRSHFLICTKSKETILVLTINHVQMDIINRLVELEPTLVKEAEILIRRL